MLKECREVSDQLFFSALTVSVGGQCLRDLRDLREPRRAWWLDFSLTSVIASDVNFAAIALRLRTAGGEIQRKALQ